MPKNSVINFKGGRFINGTIVSENSVLNADIDSFGDDLFFNGYFNNDFYAHHFGYFQNSNANKLNGILERLEKISKVLFVLSGNYTIDKTVKINIITGLIAKGKVTFFIEENVRGFKLKEH